MKKNNKRKNSLDEFSKSSSHDNAKLQKQNVSHKIKTPHELFENFMARMDEYSDDKIVECFNSQVGIKGWTGATGAYMSAIREQFEKRGIDYSEVGNSLYMSYKYKVVLENKKIKLA